MLDRANERAESKRSRFKTRLNNLDKVASETIAQIPCDGRQHFTHAVSQWIQKESKTKHTKVMRAKMVAIQLLCRKVYELKKVQNTNRCR